MTDLSEIIQHENEGTGLDFKAKEYTKEKYADFLKDVMSMANASCLDSRHIIIGMKPNAKNRNIIGIETLTDEATFQQLVSQNIEPEISLRYYPYSVGGKILGVIEIAEPTEKPFLMKKAYGTLQAGDCFIRKGSHQMRMSRSDFDKIYSTNNRIKDSDIQINFENADKEGAITLQKVDYSKLPSSEAKESIKRMIAVGELINISPNSGPFQNFATATKSITESLNLNPIFAHMPAFRGSFMNAAEHHTLEELRDDLSEVDEKYEAKDDHNKQEIQANKINFCIYNGGQEFLEDVAFFVYIPQIEGITVRKSVYDGPDFSFGIPKLRSIHEIESYPSVQLSNGIYTVRKILPQIRHGLSTTTYIKSLRIVVNPEVAPQKIIIKAEVYAKNLKQPVVRELEMIVKKQRSKLIANMHNL